MQKHYIVFSLDVPSLKEAEQYIAILSEYVGMFKIGLELFISSGPEIIKIIKAMGTAKIFLDLKLHDIPATVSRAMASIADLCVDFATVHCGENKEMLKATVAGSAGKTGVVGVTVLMSVSGEDIAAAGFRSEFSAVKNGSDYLIIGRPIRDAKNPKETVINIAKDIKTIIYSLSSPKAE